MKRISKFLVPLILAAMMLPLSSCATKPGTAMADNGANGSKNAADAGDGNADASKESEEARKEEEMKALFEKICEADEGLELAKKGGAVVFEDGCITSGQDVWDAFYADAQDKKPAKVLCADYYTLDQQNMSPKLYEEEKDQYPQFYFMLLEFDGNEYTLTTRKSTDKDPETKDTFKYLMHYTGTRPAAKFEYYVLVDDPTVTWDDIEYGMFSSQSDAMIRHRTVYSNYEK